MLLQATLLGVLLASFRLLTLTIFRALLKRESLAIAVYVLFAIWVSTNINPLASDSYLPWCYWILGPMIMAWLLIRVGFLAAVAAQTTIVVVTSAPLTTDPGQWYYSQAMLLLITVVGVAAFALYTSVGGRVFFRSLAT